MPTGVRVRKSCGAIRLIWATAQTLLPYVTLGSSRSLVSCNIWKLTPPAGSEAKACYLAWVCSIAHPNQKPS